MKIKISTAALLKNRHNKVIKNNEKRKLLKNIKIKVKPKKETKSAVKKPLDKDTDPKKPYTGIYTRFITNPVPVNQCKEMIEIHYVKTKFNPETKKYAYLFIGKKAYNFACDDKFAQTVKGFMKHCPNTKMIINISVPAQEKPRTYAMITSIEPLDNQNRKNIISKEKSQVVIHYATRECLKYYHKIMNNK